MESFIGLGLGVVVIFGGALLAGLSFGALVQPLDLVVVVGGTLAATISSFPGVDVRRALLLAKTAFRPLDASARTLVDEVVNVATVSRKEGAMALEALRESVSSPFLAKGIKFVMDGLEPQMVKDIMQAEIDLAFDEEIAACAVWETAASYAPAVGILGAVLELIRAMGNLADPHRLGPDIASAFIAIVYGLAAATLVFGPLATNLGRKARVRVRRKEIVRIGIAGIQDGLNPQSLRERLEAYLSA